MKICDVMKKTGLTKRAIRYYEEEGLICPVINKENNYREYGPEDVKRLTWISLLRQIDFSISEIRNIISRPASINEILRNHIDKIDNDICRLKYSKALISGILNRGYQMDSEDFIDRLKSIRDSIDLDDKQRYGYIRRQLLRIFPGNYGRMILLHFTPFLEEPVDTPEKEAAWIEIVNFLDNSEYIKYPDECEKIIGDFCDEDIEKFSQKNSERVRKLINASDKELKEFKQEVMESVKCMQGNDEYRRYRSTMWNISASMRTQLVGSGYYDKFVKNLRIISSDYDRYQKILYRINDELGLKYDNDGNIVFGLPG